MQGLTAFMMATSNPNDYGQLHVYETPRSTTVIGPVQADSEMQQSLQVSSTITLLDQHGSSVLLGNNVMVPLDQALLYIRPLYVTSASNPLPQLKYVIAVFNQDVAIEPTLNQALASVLGANIGTTGPSGGGVGSGSSGGSPSGSTSSVANYLQQASNDYSSAQQALKSGDLATYQHQIGLMNQAIKAAQKLLAKG